MFVNWIYSISQGNWPVAKQKLKYAVNNKSKEKRISKDDNLIFYVIGTRQIQGAFRVASDWHEPTITWNEGSDWVSEIDLELIQMGYVDIRRSADDLAFITNKSRYSIYYRASSIGPSNFGKPISNQDFNTILDGLKTVQTIEDTTTLDRVSVTMRQLPDTPSKKHLEDKTHTIDQVKPRTIKYVVDQIDNGKYAIPQFQREYKWTRRQIEELWESIFEGFFIGSILTWESTDQLSRIPVHGGPELDSPTDLVLDGQQRITSIYYTVSNPERWAPDDRPTIFFVNLKALLTPGADSSEIISSETVANAKKKGMLEKTYQFRQKIMPLTELKADKYRMWMRAFADYLRHEERDPNEEWHYEHLTMFLDHVWNGYQIPVVQLPKSLLLNSVAEVFEKINSKGTRLDVFDLLNARFTKYDVNLRKLLNEKTQVHEEVKEMIDDIPGAEKYILQAMCLYKTSSIKKSRILSLDREYMESQDFDTRRFEQDWDNVCKYVGHAIRDLKSTRKTGFGATQLSMLPYTVTIPILSALLCYVGSHQRNALSYKRKIRNWYWAVVTSDHYSGSTNSNVEKDYRELIHWFEDENKVPEIVMEQRKRLTTLKFDSTKKNDSIYKAMLCLVTKEGARDFYTDEPPEYNELDIHHLFPRAKWADYRGSVSVDSILNMTLLRSKTNRYISDKSPSVYVKNLAKRAGGEKLLAELLKTHLIPHEAFVCMKRDDFMGFVVARERHIVTILQDLMGCPQNSIKDNVPYAANSSA